MGRVKKGGDSPEVILAHGKRADQAHLVKSLLIWELGGLIINGTVMIWD
jgi:hypothetical protein